MTSRIYRSIVSAALALSLAAPALRAADITVSAAISMTDAMTAEGAAFEQDHADHLKYNFLSSGALMKQIEEGAPVDVFVSAAHEQMDDLQQRGLIDPATRQTVASNDLVVIQPAGSDVKPPSQIKDLVDPRFKRISIGEPVSVPAGLYAQQTLKSLRLYDKLKDRLKLGVNVRQVLAYVEQGEVDAGFVYRTDAMQANRQGSTGPTNIRVKIVLSCPVSAHEPIEYPAAVIKNSENPTEAKKFVDFLASQPGQQILKNFGFASPSHAATQPDK